MSRSQLQLLCSLAAAVASCYTPASSAQDARVTPTVKLVRKILPAVVSVRVERASKQPNVIEYGHGGGSVISEDGYILTNNHVVSGAKKIEVAFFQKEWTKVRLIARLPSEDLALLKIERDKPWPVLPLGRSDNLELGEPVVTIGSAGGLPHTLSTGVISGLGRATNTEHAHLPSMVQTSAPISGGSSGGALVNALGEQIGVITSRKTDGENLGFAITVDRVREMFPKLLNVKERFGIVHGIAVDPFHDDGAKIVKIEEGSPASEARLQPGDVIHHIDDRKITGSCAFQMALIDRKAGDALALSIRRDEDQLEVTLKLSAANMVEPVEATGLKPGLRVERFAGEWKQLPDFNSLTPEETFISKQSPTTSKEGEKDHYAELFTGFIKIPSDDFYTFAIVSDDGSRLTIGERLIADNDGWHSETEVAGVVRLRQGHYPIRIEFFEATGDQALRVSVEDARGHRKSLPAGWLFHSP